MHDTDPRIAEMQLAKYRSMTPAARLALAFDLSELAREFALAGIRRRHPGISDRDAARELLRLAGAELPRT